MSYHLLAWKRALHLGLENGYNHRYAVSHWRSVLLLCWQLYSIM